MKKLIFNVFLCGALCTACIFFFSCKMFTTSLAKGARRDPKEVLKNLSPSELIAFSQNGAYAADPKTAAAILELLGKNKDKLKDLLLKDKEQVLTLLPEASLPIKNIKIIVAEALKLGQNGATEQSDKDFVKELMDNVQPVDTEAASTLLNDREVMESAKPEKLATTAVTLMMQAVKNVGYDKVKTNVINSGDTIDFKTETADAIVTKMLGAEGSPTALGSLSDRKALKAAVSAVQLLSGNPNATDSAGKPVARDDIDPAKLQVGGAFSLDKVLKAFLG